MILLSIWLFKLLESYKVILVYADIVTWSRRSYWTRVKPKRIVVDLNLNLFIGVHELMLMNYYND